MKATDSIQASLLKASIRFLYVGAKNSHISVVAAPFLNGNNKERTFTAKVVKRKSANHTRTLFNLNGNTDEKHNEIGFTTLTMAAEVMIYI